MQPDEISDGTSAQQTHELLLHIGRGLRAAFDKSLSDPLPTQLDELIEMIRLRADEAQAAGEDERS